MRKIKLFTCIALLGFVLSFAGSSCDYSGSEEPMAIKAVDTTRLGEGADETQATWAFQWIPDSTRCIMDNDYFENYLNTRSDGKGLWIRYDSSGAGSSWDDVFRTEDGGKTWVSLGTLKYCTAGRKYTIREDTVVMVSECEHVDGPYSASIRISADYGDTWNEFAVETLLPRGCGSKEHHIYPQVLGLEEDLLTLGFFRCDPINVHISDDTRDRYYFYIASYRIREDALELDSVIYEDEYYRDGVFDSFVLPDSSVRTLSEEYVWSQLGDDYQVALRLAVNEIYARGGYSFAGTKYEEYFSALSWYTDSGEHKTEFSALEQQNVDFLAYIEQQLKSISNASCNPMKNVIF